MRLPAGMVRKGAGRGGGSSCAEHILRRVLLHGACHGGVEEGVPGSSKGIACEVVQEDMRARVSAPQVEAADEGEDPMDCGAGARAIHGRACPSMLALGSTRRSCIVSDIVRMIRRRLLGSLHEEFWHLHCTTSRCWSPTALLIRICIVVWAGCLDWHGQHACQALGGL